MSDHPAILEIAMEMAFPHAFLEDAAKRFGPDTARQFAMSTSVGGIGPLLRERVADQAAFGIDVIGVSLMYETVWVQAWHEWGQINLSKRNVGKALRQCLIKSDLDFNLTMFDGSSVPVEVWELNYSGARVFFLSSLPITEVVYPGPKDLIADGNPYASSHDLRLKQSWLVGRGALELSKRLNRKPTITILSETPTFAGQHRLIKDAYQNDPFFSDTRYIFNDHTPLEYAHPIWDQQTLETVKLDSALYVNKSAWNPQRKTLDLTSLLVSACEGVFGVAKKHGDVMRAMPSLKPYADKIQYVTNGVRREDWQAPEFTNPESLSNEALLATKKTYRDRLLDWAWRACRLWPTWMKESQSRKVVVWTRRITPYKRLDLLVKLLRNAEFRERFLQLNLVIFVGGRIHQQDNHAQDIMYDLLDILEKDRDVQQRVIPIINFNVWEAPILFRGADATIMMADDTREASATGFMKGQMNGAAIIATPDGAVPEFVATDGPKRNGFNIPYVNGEPTAQGLLEALEAFDRSMMDGDQAVGIVRAALDVSKAVGVRRTVEDMNKLYFQILHPAHA